jgi:hypothetical protein
MHTGLRYIKLCYYFKKKHLQTLQISKRKGYAVLASPCHPYARWVLIS